VDAINAEGIPLVAGYVKPIYLEPMYQQRIAFGEEGYPFTYPGYQGQVSYDQGICPVTERMYTDELMFTNICHAGIQQQDLDDFINAFQKVFRNLDALGGNG
jgi:dTDP-4-amino-4,6-dideoxygalactose transaminase